MQVAEAEVIAAAGLEFLARETARLTRFLRLTGLEPAELAARADEPALAAAVLDHLMADESLLLVFASELAAKPEAIVEAHRLLTDVRDRS
jgi:hypothetical protein